MCVIFVSASLPFARRKIRSLSGKHTQQLRLPVPSLLLGKEREKRTPESNGAHIHKQKVIIYNGKITENKTKMLSKGEYFFKKFTVSYRDNLAHSSACLHAHVPQIPKFFALHRIHPCPYFYFTSRTQF